MAQQPNTPTSIEALMADRIHDAVERWCKTDVPLDDEARANEVIIGKPTVEIKKDIVLSVHMQHPFGPVRDRDTTVSGAGTGGLTGRPYFFPMETMGGARIEEVVGCVQVRIRKKMKYDDAVWLIAAVIERAKQAINRDTTLRRISDDLGNTMFLIEAFRVDGYESGGGRMSVNFRWVDFRAYVTCTNCRI